VASTIATSDGRPDPA